MPMYGITGMLLGLNQANDATIREKAATAQSKMDMALQKEQGTKQLANAETDWSNFKRDFGGLESKMAKRADEGIQGDVAGAAGKANADVAQGVASRRGNTRAMLAQGGINPNSGRGVATMTGANTLGADVGGKAVNTARTGEQNRIADVNNAQRLQFVSLGKGLPTEANANLNAAHGITATDAGQNAALANYYGGQRNEAYGNIGRGLGNMPWKSIGKGISSLFTSSNTQPPTDTSTTNSFFGNGALSSYGNSGGSGDTGFTGAGSSGYTGGDWAPSADFKHGGIVKKPGHYAEGGVIRGPGTGTSDSIPAVIDGDVTARVSDKEYIIPAAVVDKIGKMHLDKLVAAFHGR